MEQVKKILEFFNEKYGNHMWLLSRLLFVICVSNLCIHLLAIFAMLLCPFITLLIGDGIVGFLAWYFIPAPIVVSWLYYEVTKYIYYEYIDV